jgi:hypothetical protein
MVVSEEGFDEASRPKAIGRDHWNTRERQGGFVREGKGNIFSGWTERITFLCNLVPFPSADMFLV